MTQCEGLSAETYDLYVLGLLDEEARARLDTHVREHCPSCLQGVQRSMNLWIVFASTLQSEEPSEDFRSRLIRIAELSKKVLVFPRAAAAEHSRALRWWFAGVSTVVLLVLMAGAWRAGTRSGGIEQQRLSIQLNQLSQQVVATQLQLQQAEARTKELEKALGPSGRGAIIDERAARKQSLIWQAEADQYKSIIDRQQTKLEDNNRLVDMLSSPGVHMMPLKGAESAVSSTAYALILDNSKLVLVAANLPKLAPEKQFQLWLLRTQEPKVVNAGVFTPDDENRAVLQFENPPVLTDIATLVITDEPEGGSAAPTGAKLLASVAQEAE